MAWTPRGENGQRGASRRSVLGLALALPFTGVTLGAIGRAVAQDTQIVRIGAGPTGGTDFLFGGLIANAISNPPGSRECDKGGNCGVPGLIAVAQTTPGAMENLRAVSRGDMDMGLAPADAATWAFYGSGTFSGEEPLSRLRVIARLYPENIHLVTRANAAISAVHELKGKRVGVGDRGSATEATARQVLEAYGLRWNAIYPRHFAFTATTDALASDKIDAFFMVGGAPILVLEDLARRTPIHVVPMAGPVATKVAKVLPFYSLGAVPAGVYGATTAVPTLDVGSVLLARDNLDDNLAFGIAKAIWHESNVALFANGHPAGKLMDPHKAAQGFGVPVHPGAARYYESQGIEVRADIDPATLRRAERSLRS